jgi:hypothetical protein
VGGATADDCLDELRAAHTEERCAASHWQLRYPAMRAVVWARLVEKPISLPYHAATESNVP